MESVQAALEISDVGLHVASDEQRHIIPEIDLLEFGELAQDGDPRLEVRRLDVRYQAPADA
jgi:hypothetical protein